jgi:hypothetical protein
MGKIKLVMKEITPLTGEEKNFKTIDTERDNTWNKINKTKS